MITKREKATALDDGLTQDAKDVVGQSQRDVALSRIAQLEF